MKNVFAIARYFFTVSIVCSVSIFANAQQELTLAPDTTDRLFVMFSARAPAISPVSAGHAFVSMGKTTNAMEACVTDTYGFYPCDGCSLTEGDHPGRVVKGFQKNRNKKRLVWFSVVTDSAHLVKTQAVVEKWEKVKYHLGKRNCVRFISEMAASQGLNTPSSTYLGFIPKFPRQYIRQLKRANPGQSLSINNMHPAGIPYCLDENKDGIPDTPVMVQVD